ncbi:MAG: hypothetical protein CR995_00250 [Clostridiales bacterium]|nr:MAG: hypothetical protein CR995_00250 [Clostridiales bacterium]
MSEESKIIDTLLARYDYAGVYDLLIELGLAETDLAYIVKSCRYAINFDFDSAIDIIYAAEDKVLLKKPIKNFIESLRNAKAGRAEAVFSELIESVKIQLLNDELIDFLGRVYRFKEAILKYLFIQRYTGNKRIDLLSENMSKRYQLRVLRSKFDIHNSNISYAITVYFEKHQADDFKAKQIIEILESKQMNRLIELRNDSIVGHGFTGISRRDLADVYGDPMSVIDQFYECLRLLELKVDKKKYDSINKFLRALSSHVKARQIMGKVIHFE